MVGKNRKGRDLQWAARCTERQRFGDHSGAADGSGGSPATGAAILGMNGDKAVHSLLDIMAADQPYTVISRAVHFHPTVSELVPTLLQQLKPVGK